MAATVAGRAGGARAWTVPWRALLATILVLIAGAIGLEPIWRWLHAQWSSVHGIYSHGYLNLMLSMWMGYRYWRRDPPDRLRPDWRGAVPLAGLVGLLAIMGLVFIDASRSLLLPPVFLCCVWLLFGAPAVRRLLLPALFLYFAIAPFWLFNVPLQSLAAVVVGQVIVFSGFTAYLDGKFIHIPAGIFEIAQGCSGVSYFVAALTLACFFALMYLRKKRYRLLLVGVAGLAAIFSNWVRIYTLILIGHFTDMQHSLVAEHNTYGWIVFLVFFAPVLMLARWLEGRELATVGASAATNAFGARKLGFGATSPGSQSSGVTSLAGSLASWSGAAVLASTLLLVPALVGWGGSLSSSPAGVGLLPYVSSTAREVDRFPSAWSPVTQQAVEQRLVDKWGGGETFEVYRALYPVQDWGAELFTSGNSVTGEGWRQLGVSLVEVNIAGQKMQVVEHVGILYGQRRLIWSWYYVAGTPVVNRQYARLVQLKGIFAGRRDAGVLAVSLVCGWGCDESRAILRGYVEEAGAGLLVDHQSFTRTF
ncbi:exosortase C-terminal domain/associated protein EpsI [Desulfurivibrio alkaliphilus]|uniref:Eight transmembrane protein EpsH n=1 Tax=Desulfurivibrio alkaliphilus (strain DSM 19089 / UNIQEM U267 / AHT2) TaxID=589865 RepID=D6Z4G2_DESAT|nr:EpsI domain-containing exosortase [Desulfurivibrio alkaliphilus]ADH86437.1 eight transmembrane protein EpsH [Desulfurivibrio alkaliphilus AHT 2]